MWNASALPATAARLHNRIRPKWYIIELKLIRAHDSPAEIRRYRDRIAPAALAHLFLFDRRSATKSKPWDDRIGRETEDTIRIVGC